MDFATGKLMGVARHQRARRTREYAVLWVVLSATTAPYLLAACYWPWVTLCCVLFLAYFQVLISYVTSSGTDTAHHIRAILAGSNPVAMTGSSSLLFGAVDLLMDWAEDRSARQSRPLRYWPLVVHKLVMTPIGVVLMFVEYFWDTVLQGRPGLVRHKWNELFSLAYYHDLICPERSNDLFYADLAMARFKQDPHLYQWNRLRAMVFELKQQNQDVEDGLGTGDNLFLQDPVSAYQTLKRLRIEVIEQRLESHYLEHIDQFPVPPTLATQLVKNAQPIQHFIRMKRRLLKKGIFGPATDGFSRLLEGRAVRHLSWHVLRLLDDCAEPFSSAVSAHIRDDHLLELADAGVLMKVPDELFGWSESFRHELDALVAAEYSEVSAPVLAEELLRRVPHVLNYRSKAYCRARDGE